MLPVEAHTEMLAEQFMAGNYQSRRADYKTTFSTSFRPVRPTQSPRETTHKQYRPVNLQIIQKCAQRHPPTHVP